MDFKDTSLEPGVVGQRAYFIVVVVRARLALEREAAVRVLRSLPITVPSTTGARRPLFPWIIRLEKAYTMLV